MTTIREWALPAMTGQEPIGATAISYPKFRLRSADLFAALAVAVLYYSVALALSADTMLRDGVLFVVFAAVGAIAVSSKRFHLAAIVALMG